MIVDSLTKKNARSQDWMFVSDINKSMKARNAFQRMRTGYLSCLDSVTCSYRWQDVYILEHLILYPSSHFLENQKKDRELDGSRNRINEMSGENLLLRPF
jgi:hypothetical protein